MRLAKSIYVKSKLCSTSRWLSHSRVSSVGNEIISPIIGLTNDQTEFYNLARQFADSEMKPFASKWEEEGELPMATMKKLAEMGFAGIVVKDDVGGSGLSRVDSTVIVEALATGCVGTTAMLTIHNMCGWMIDEFGTHEQRASLLPSLCSMDTLASYCLTEPQSGSDAASLQTTATLDNTAGQYVINGGKAFISGAGTSGIYLVMCRTGGSKADGVSCILVPRNSPGLSFGSNENKMGWKVQPTRQVMFEEVRVPVNNLLGVSGNGFRMAMAALDGGRLSIAACSLGAAQASMEIALAYVKERKQFGNTLASNQSVQFKLADMAGKLITSRQMLRSAAALLDAGHPSASSHCALAKKVVTDSCFEICNDALQLHGGYGYLRDYHVERYVRDTRVHQILEGTNEIMRVIVGRALTTPSA